MKIKPYVALDIETTGLEDGNQVLQVAMIFDDGKTPIVELEAHSFFVDNSDEIFTGRLEPVALEMNSWIYKEINKDKKKMYPVFKTPKARAEFRKLLLDYHSKLEENQSITFAGKNIAGFDIRHLTNNGFFEGFPKYSVSHRFIDIGSLYYPDFGYVPTQKEINKIVGRKDVTHDAFNDATDVVCAVRHKLKLGI